MTCDGADTIKVNVSGDRDWGHMHADDTVTVIAERELAAVMEVANARRLMVATLGFTPMNAIVAATRQGDEPMRMEHEAGQIKPGFLADLLVLDGNPLDDIRFFQDQARILGVMKGGRFAKRAAGLSQARSPRRKAA